MRARPATRVLDGLFPFLVLATALPTAACKESFDALDSEDGEDTGTSSETEDSGGDGGTGDGDTGDTGGGAEESLCGAEALPFGLQAGGTVDVGGSLIAIEVGDYFGTDAADIIAIDYENGLLVYLEGNGNALFPTRYDALLGGQSRDFAVADIEDNGDFEIFVALTAQGADPITQISVYPADPSLDAEPISTLEVSTDGFGMEFIDLDNDGRRDDLVLSGSEGVGTTDFHLQAIIGLDDTPTFSESAVMGFMPWYMGIGDFNNDELDDVIVVNVDEGQASPDDSLEIFVGDGVGNLAFWASLGVGQDPRDVDIADFNDDGFADFALSIINTSNADSAEDYIEIWLGDGSANFEKTAEIEVGAFPSAVITRDLNCDGYEDIIVTAEFDNTVVVLLSHGDGTFTEDPFVYAAGQVPSVVESADFNGDGFPDLAVGNWTSGDITILLGRSS